MTAAHLYLALAIVSEVVATSSLKATQEFSRIGPSIFVLVGYCLSFWLLALALRSIPVGIAYASWAGLGIVLVAVAGIVFHSEHIDLAGGLGMALIIAGVVTLHLFSGMKVH